MKIVILNGTGGAGKDTFAVMCQDILGAACCLNISTVDFVKEVAELCGWDGTKTLRNREFLSDLKDLLTEWNDVPFKKIEQKIRMLENWHEDWIMFVDCREPQEIQKIKERLKALTVIIRRPEAEDAETSNHADAEVLNYDYDLTIWNDCDKIELANKALEFMEYLEGEF